MNPQLTVAIAGATGYVGTALSQSLSGHCRVVGLSRRPRRGREDGDASAVVDLWRSCDLYSLLDAERALRGADVAVYLVHSMMPRDRLTQGTFADLDLLLADNFARAAARAGVARIIYLGGLIPDSPSLSPHLASRLEVERALGAYGARVTTLRAGLILGAEGSSSRMLRALVERLPAMACPQWTESRTEAVVLEDVIALLRFFALSPTAPAGTFDVGSGEVLSYRELMTRMADAMSRRRTMIPVPLLTPRLSTLWVSLVTGAPRSLVRPLVESLKHDMVPHDRRVWTLTGLTPTPIEVGLRDVAQSVTQWRRRRRRTSPYVRSVQRLPLPPGRSAEWVAREYMRWLPGHMRGAFDVVVTGTMCRFYLRGTRTALLEMELSEARSSRDRPLFYVLGGLLAGASPRGRLEFREALGGEAIVAALHEFLPRLWWPIYRVSQAIIHERIMRAFGRHLAALGPHEPHRPAAEPPPKAQGATPA